ncbi:MAG: hypothetical protein S4CHLAM7_03260 [Chlamydiae bacterium]|nr:hypothetical protein [Chlamydiota bacterium]
MATPVAYNNEATHRLYGATTAAEVDKWVEQGADVNNDTYYLYQRNQSSTSQLFNSFQTQSDASSNEEKDWLWFPTDGLISNVNYRFTPLHMAKTAEVVKRLIHYKADVDVKNYNSETPIFMHSSPEIIKSLVNAKADPNALSGKINHNTTPLFYAKRLDSAQALLAAGANSLIRDDKGKHVLYYLVKTRDFAEEVFKLILLDTIEKSQKNPNYPAIKNLSDIKDFEGNTLLHTFTRPEHVEFLVKQGLDINERNVKGWTPLHVHINGSAPSMIQALISESANPNAVNFNGDTPLHLCGKECNSGREMAQHLIQSGADLTTLNFHGLDPYGNKPVINADEELDSDSDFLECSNDNK